MNCNWMSELSDLTQRAQESIAAGDTTTALTLLETAAKLVTKAEQDGAATFDISQSKKFVSEIASVAQALQKQNQRLRRAS